MTDVVFVFNANIYNANDDLRPCEKKIMGVRMCEKKNKGVGMCEKRARAPEHR